MNCDLPESSLYPKDAFLVFNSNRPNQTQPFMIDLQLQYRLKRKQKALLVLLANDWEHTSSVGAKLGVNLSMYRQNGLLDYVNLYDIMKNDNGLDVAWEAFTSAVFSKAQSLDENSILMVDDLSLLYIVHPSPSDVYDFIDKLMKVLAKKKCSILIGSTVETGDERSDAHSQMLKHQADVWIDCGGANSGFSQNFDGIIKCSDMRTNSSISANYKLQQRSVVFSNI